MSSSLCFGGFFELIIIVVIGFPAFSVFCGAVTFAPLVTAFVFWIPEVCATDDAAVVVRVVSAGFAADPPPSSLPLIFDERSLRVKF
jgi:hypothetical protein